MSQKKKLKKSSRLADYSLDYQEKTLYVDNSFRNQLQETVRIIEKLPKLRNTVLMKMSQWQNDREERAAQAGLHGAKLSRDCIKEYNRKLEEEKETLLKKFIENEPNACHASNLYRLLTKKWTEEANAWKIQSKLTPKKEKRIKVLLLEDRYN